MKNGDNEQLRGGCWGSIRTAMRNRAGSGIEIIVLAIIVRLFDLIEPFAFQALIDRIIPFQREQSVFLIALLFIGIALFDIALRSTGEYLSAQVSLSLVASLAKNVYAKFFRVPLAITLGWGKGGSLTRCEEIESIKDFFSSGAMTVAIDAVFAVIYAIALFSISPSLALIVIAVIPFEGLLYIIFASRIENLLSINFSRVSEYRNSIVHSINSGETIRSFQAEHMISQLFNTQFGKWLRSEFSVLIMQLLYTQISTTISKFAGAAIIFLGAMAVIKGQLTLGELIAFHLLATRFSEPLMRVVEFWQEWQRALIAQQRLDDILDAPTEEGEGVRAEARLPSVISGELRFNAVSFAYSTDRVVLNQITATCRPGRIQLIVGPSGVGKTTLGRLAIRLYKPSSGSITLDGVDIATLTSIELRNNILYQPQEANLLPLSCRDNITFGSTEKTDEDIWEAIRSAEAQDVIASLPDGLDTVFSDGGASLSGGQRQRISLARALCRNPKVLILDEPTSSLDEKTSAAIANTLMKLARDITVIVITHQPSHYGLEVDCTFLGNN